MKTYSKPNANNLDKNQLEVAIVCDWLVGGGAEKVVQELHKMYPGAPIYTSYRTEQWQKKLNNKVITGYLQKWPFSALRKFLPVLRYFWFKKLDLQNFDVVISVTGNGEAKHIQTSSPTKHICYCHSPTHFYWRKYKEYIKNPGFGFFNPLARLGLKLLINPLKKRDYSAAQSVDKFIANSTHIKNDIKKFYNQESVVIHPPINIERFSKPPFNNKRSGFITVGRQVPYKRVDLIIKACNKLGKNLTVIGNGQEHNRLKKLAGPTINFITDANDNLVVEELKSAEAFLFASFEDFGIAPVEAMAAGTPVIAYKAGGALDYVVEGKTGLFFNQQNVESLINVVNSFDKNNFSSQNISKHAQKFSSDQFQSKFNKLLDNITSNKH